MSSQYKPPLEDMLFLLGEVFDWTDLFSLPAFEHVDAELASAVLEKGAKLAEEIISPANSQADKQGCSLKDGKVLVPEVFHKVYREFADGGWIGLDLPKNWDGQGLPFLVQTAFSEMVSGACQAFGMLPINCRSGAWLLHEHAEPELAQLILPNLVSGNWTATIAMTEPQAGSDVSRIRTRAVLQDDGSYRISGSKIFISFADHDLAEQIVHLVLARTEDAMLGARGLSLFLVPRNKFDDNKNNGIAVSRVEHKMGLNGSATCALDIDQAIGYRIGEERKGLKVMFTMMNIMRLECATQGVGVASAAVQRALQYTNERPQGGRPDQKAVLLNEHADVRRMLMTMRARTEAMRALVYQAALFLDQARAAIDTEKSLRSASLAEFLLPVCKTCAAEYAFETANQAVQVFGGHGYVADAGVEQYVRDARVISIYEGASGIQAQDLVKRKLLGDQGVRYHILAKQIRDELSIYKDDELLVIRQATEQGLNALESVTQDLLKKADEDPFWSSSVATDYLHLVGLVTGGWMWLRMAAVAASDSPFHKGKRQVAEFYAGWVMAEVAMRVIRIKQDALNIKNISKDELMAGFS